TYFEKALALYDPEQHRDYAFRYSQNPGVATRSHASWALWFLGEPDRALEVMHEALSLAEELAEPHGLAHTFLFISIVHQLRGEARIAQECAEASIAISVEHGLVLYEATSTVVRGWARTEQGWAEGVDEIRRGLAAYEATGTQLLRPHFLA